ncbi:hypothetical protein Poli38472_001917 [Pythium oligandrum]|uniref:Uncharacterized protein n=1 Tax=Pythium oligandrum TaxID=41045 RepID=A0A8K1CW89_PYTOL|nr:hypothetical protein Poli38472_001917 [Pythium oligandrum]|eukprot:TMW69761.1 hypothetical protein Poli38472_001917 [Pythium oligandrum]
MAATLSPGSMAILCSTDLAEYEVLEVLGHGSFGIVRLARHRETGRAVAIKILDKDHIIEWKQETNIFREQTVHLELDHPFISRLHTTFQDAEAVYFILEFCPGGELYSLVYQEDVEEELPKDDEICPTESESDDDDLRKPVRTEDVKTTSIADDVLYRQKTNAAAKRALKSSLGGIRESHAAFYLACISFALEHLHEQDILYRDLKLENVVIDINGYPKLIDFGLSKPEAAQRARNNTVCGSMEYMAPEVVQRDAYNFRADMWSFGIIMYEMLFGTTPFYDANQREQSRRICDAIVEFPNNAEEEYPLACALIRSLLSKSPTERPASFQEVRDSAYFKRYFPTTSSWKQLLSKQARAPFVPAISGDFDTSLFAKSEEAEDESYAM